MKKKYLLFIIFLLLGSVEAYGQLSLFAELRPRGEIDNGIVRPLSDTMSTRYYLTQRTRLGMTYKKSIFEMKISAQDVRVWGSGDIYSSTGVFGNTSGIDLFEGWLKINFGEKSSLKIGRQQLSFDNERLVASRNWSQFGLAYDAFLFMHQFNSWNLDVVLSYNSQIDLKSGKPIYDEELFNADNLMKTFNLIRINNDISEKINFSALFIAAGYTNEANQGAIYLTGTYGIYSEINLSPFLIQLYGYYQSGKAQNGKDVEAFALGLRPTLNLRKIKIGIGFDYLSGDDANSSNYNTKEKTFNKLYGAVFKYHGWMNYYSYIKASTLNGGLVDVFSTISSNISENHKIEIKMHLFRLANSVFAGEEIVNDLQLGSELDLAYNYKHSELFSLYTGFSYYFATESFKLIKMGNNYKMKDPYWFWVMFSFSPKIL